MMKERKGKILAYALVIFWMCFIFLMSNQPADVSNGQSDLVINLLKAVGANITSANIDLITTIVRKGAHFTEYCILALLYYNVLRFYISNKKARLIAIGLVFLYASTDEFHQTFVQGRAGKFTDVLIDTSGGAFGAIIVYLFNINKKWL